MPSFEVRQTDELKQWLIRELEPICDADPEVLSDYVLALLKHDASDGDLQAKLQEQLEDFLAEQTNDFVQKTLDALQSHSYLPASKRAQTTASVDGTSAGSGAVTAQESVAGSSRKRSAEDEGRRSPPKTQRDSDQYESGGRRREFDARERRDGGGGGSASGGAEGSDQRGKPLCRDFHQRGFCARGDSCRYDHTLPASGENFSMNPMMGGGGGGGGPMGMPPQMRQSHLPPGAQAHPFGFSPAHMGQPFPVHGQPPMGWNGQPPMGMTPVGGSFNGMDGGSHGNGSPINGEGHGQPRGDSGGAHRGGGRGGMRGFGRGGGAGGRGTFEKRPTSSTTLVIENVPPEHLELVKVNEYFKKFGTITNIQIDVDSKKALVSYSQPAEAKAAHSSPEVIFNNRFVKVYFQKLDDPFVKPKETAPAAPPLKNNFVPGQTSNKFVRPNLAQEKVKEVQEQAQKKLDVLMAEQKDIMTKLTGGSATAEEKKTLMARFGTLEGEIKQATEEVRNAVSGTVSATTRQTSTTSTTPGSAEWKEEKEKRQREQLDRELEALKNGSGGANGGATTEELKATLARLQAEAEQLGIDANDPSAASSSSSYRGGFRGRGRGTYRGGYNSFHRGRGGAAPFSRSTMSLDNRTSRLHITDVPEGGSSEKGVKVKEHLKQFGEVHSVEDKPDGSFVIHYKARASGERAVRTGLSVPDIGTIKAQWTNEGNNESNAAGATSEHQAEEEEVGLGEDDGVDREDNFRR